MKKIGLVILIAAYCVLSACNRAPRKEQDSVETSEEMNEVTTKGIVDKDASEFLVKAASGGMMEVQLGKLIQEKAINPRVKAFGAMMVKDHTKAGEEIKNIAMAKNIILPDSMGKDHKKHYEEMKSRKGIDLDKEYMQMMQKDHEEDMEVFEEAAEEATDPQIKAFASKTLPVLKVHLDSARAIRKAIK